MAKKLESGEEPTAPAIRLMAPATVKNFHKDATVLENRKTKINEDLSEHFAEGRKKHLESKAYKLLAWCLKIAPKKPDAIASFLASFDHYREAFKLDEMVNLHGRLFPDKDEKKPSDDERDFRPTHMRQPNALASSESSPAENAVKQLAGGKDHLDLVGRGKPN